MNQTTNLGSTDPYTSTQWKLLKPRIKRGSVGYFRSDMDFRVEELQYFAYLHECEKNGIMPIKPKLHNSEKGYYYFVVSYEQIESHTADYEFEA